MRGAEALVHAEPQISSSNCQGCLFLGHGWSLADYLQGAVDVDL